jgi:hypothetical protein
MLRGGTTSQQAQLGHSLGECTDKLIVTRHDDMDGRQGGYQSSIALVGEHHDCTALGNQRICPADAHTGIEE